MNFDLEKRDVERVLTDLVNSQSRRRKKLEMTSAKTSDECRKREEIIIRYEIVETLLFSLGLTNELINGPDKLNTINIK